MGSETSVPRGESDEEVAALIKGFINAVNGYEAHVTALRLPHWLLDATLTSAEATQVSELGLKVLPVTRVRVARSHLTAASGAIRRSAALLRAGGSALNEAMTRYEEMVFTTSERAGAEIIESAANGNERDSQAIDGFRAEAMEFAWQGIVKVNQFIGTRPSLAQMARYYVYLSSQTLSAALYQIEITDFTQFIREEKQLIESADTPPLPFANMFIHGAKPQPVVTPLPNFKRNEEQLAWLVVDGDQTAGIRNWKSSARAVLQVALPGSNHMLLHNMAMYLYWGNRAVRELKVDEPVPGAGRFVGDQADHPTRRIPVVLVEPRSWRRRIRQQQKPAVTHTPQSHPADPFDRRGTWVKYALTPDGVAALGLDSVVGASYFWIGWRSETRVFDPKWRATREKPTIPDSAFRVRKAIPGRPDLPTHFNLFEVFAETGTLEQPVFERLGTHPRSLGQGIEPTHQVL